MPPLMEWVEGDQYGDALLSCCCAAIARVATADGVFAEALIGLVGFQDEAPTAFSMMMLGLFVRVGEQGRCFYVRCLGSVVFFYNSSVRG